MRGGENRPEHTYRQYTDCSREHTEQQSESSLQLNRTQQADTDDFILCGVVTVTFRVLSLFVVTKCYSYSKILLQLTVVPPGEYPIVTVTFGMLSLFVVTKCYSYSKIVLQLIVVPPGKYPINRLTNPNPRQ
jgi:hypothetical protein